MVGQELLVMNNNFITYLKKDVDLVWEKDLDKAKVIPKKCSAIL